MANDHVVDGWERFVPDTAKVGPTIRLAAAPSPEREEWRRPEKISPDIDTRDRIAF